jgi:3-carboxy-cis,cis-muconate cycloisomerase
VSFLALIGRPLGNIALNIIIMLSNELGEVSEPFIPPKGALPNHATKGQPSFQRIDSSSVETVPL